MARRSDDFIADLESTHTGKVYFQPPASVRLVYPCWVIERESMQAIRADDRSYVYRPTYKCMFMNRDEPDPEILRIIPERYPRCSYRNHYVVDNIHHDVFSITY